LAGSRSSSAATEPEQGAKPELEQVGPVEVVPEEVVGRPTYGETARRALVSTLVVVAVIACALALWKLKVLVALLFAAITIAAAMRPGVEWLHRHHIPRPLGVAIHYIAFLGLIALFLSFVVPDMISQVQAAMSAAQHHKLHTGSTLVDRALSRLEMRLQHLPKGGSLVHPAVSIGEKALEVLVGIFFVFATAAYWLFERDRAINVVASLVPRPRRKTLRDTWELMDLKLGAFIRGQLLMIAIVSTLVSIGLWIAGEPYFILLGITVGILEIVPVVGPLAGLILVVLAGLSVDIQTAIKAGAAVLLIRVAQDYFINPHVMGGAVGMSPLIVMTNAIAVATLFGPFYVLLSVPIASLVVTIFEVAVLKHDPAEQEVPAVLFSADSEA
jgi:predicted PurR-regulated permease PerM